MSIKSLTYLDIPEPERHRAALQEVGRLKASLSNPGLTLDQIQKVKDRIEYLSLWVAGQL